MAPEDRPIRDRDRSVPGRRVRDLTNLAPETQKAWLIFDYAKQDTAALRDQCSESRRTRRERGGGALTDAEQDLLRAMLVFAAAGLDSLLKRLIRDALGSLAERDADVQRELEAFVSRRIRGERAPGLGE